MDRLEWLKSKRKTLMSIQKQMIKYGYKKVDYALDGVILEITLSILNS